MPTEKTKARSQLGAQAKRTAGNGRDGSSGISRELIASGRVGSVPQLIFGDLWEYDPAPESADPKIKPRYELFIGGKFVAPKSGKYFDSINPKGVRIGVAEDAGARAWEIHL